MPNTLTEIKETLFPKLSSRDGPLPPMLVAMTVVTGLVDAFSYLTLGHVFVANMTGNVVFLAFALAGAKGFSIPASILAIVAFILGAIIAGRMNFKEGQNRGRLLFAHVVVQAVLVGIAALLTAILASSTDLHYVLIALLAVSMGVQNAAARKLAVPDLTTTVLTLTIVGIGADSRIAKGSGSKAGRRLVSISSMFLGALMGALAILYSSSAIPLAIAFVIVSSITVASRILSRKNAEWLKPR
jgi:uncharacterized membrane protein YoaK (UPF0700 family)